MKFIFEEGLILIPFLNIIGEFLKGTDIKDKYIPLILLVVSTIFSPIFLGGYNAHNIVQAVLIAGSSVGGYELFHELGKKEDK